MIIQCNVTKYYYKYVKLPLSGNPIAVYFLTNFLFLTLILFLFSCLNELHLIEIQFTFKAGENHRKQEIQKKAAIRTILKY